ncbi:MAG TPA: hypothetical protein VGO67_11070 [Verrucomicrobiae bacterium]|jgi:hypothetical protein
MTAKDNRASAFTRIELVVVTALLAVLIYVFILPMFARARQNTMPIRCINNMKQIGIAYRIWSNDNGDKFPAEVPQALGGWRELALSTNARAFAWTNYAAMAIEMGQSAKIVVCPKDERQPAPSFTNISNTNVSYFIGPGADEDFPQAILGGDRNLSPGMTPHDDYGFSPADDSGNDVTTKGPVCWSLKMHSEGSSFGRGNIMLADGSVSEVGYRGLILNSIRPAMEAYRNITNGPVSSNGIRLIFP